MIRQAGTDVFFGGKKKELSADAQARREKDELARQKRRAMPMSLQMRAPVLTDRTGARQLDLLHDRYERATRKTADNPFLAQSLSELSADSPASERLADWRQRENALIDELANVTDLYMTDVAQTDRLPETISAIGDPTLRRHLMMEYLLHFYDESDDKLVKVLCAIEDQKAQGDWKLLVLSLDAPRFKRLSIEMLSGMIVNINEQQKELAKPAEPKKKNRNDAVKKPDDAQEKKPKITKTPQELADSKKVTLLLLKSAVEQASGRPGEAMGMVLAHTLMRLPDEDLEALLPSIQPGFIQSLGWADGPIDNAAIGVNEFRRHVLTALLGHKDAGQHEAALDYLTTIQDEALRNELVEYAMNDSEYCIRAALLDRRIKEDEKPPSAEAVENKTEQETGETQKEAQEQETKNDEDEENFLNNGKPLLSPKQCDALLLALATEPVKSPFFKNEEWVLMRTAINIHLASCDEVKVKLIHNLIRRKSEYYAAYIEAWGIWQTGQLDSDAEKARIVRRYVRDSFPENNKFWEQVVFAMKDPQVQAQTLQWLVGHKEFDIAGTVFRWMADDKKKPMPQGIRELAVQQCLETAKTGENGVFGMYCLHSVEDAGEREKLASRIYEKISPNVRWHAYMMTPEIESYSARVAFVERMLGDADDGVRQASVYSFSELQDRDFTRLAGQALRDPDPLVRQALLGELTHPAMKKQGSLYKAILRRLSMPDNTQKARLSVAGNTEKIKDAALRSELLQRLSRDTDPGVRDAALKNLDVLTDREALSEIALEMSQRPDYVAKGPMIQAVRKTRVPLLNAQLQADDAPSMAALMRLFPADTKKAAQGKWIGLVHAMPSLQMMGMLGLEAGEMPLKIMPQYYQVREHAKSLVNMLNDPEDDHINAKQVDATFLEYRTEILLALTVLGAEPLRHKLSLTLRPFRKLLRALISMPRDPRVFGPMYQLAHMPGVNPEDVTKMLEVAAGLCALNRTDVAANMLSAMAERKHIDVPQMSRVYLKELIRQWDPKAEVSDAQLDRWDLSMVPSFYYLQQVLSKSDRVKILHELMSAIANDRLPEFLEGKDNDTGRVNRHTDKVFQRHGLDVETWLHYPGTLAFSSLSPADREIRSEMAGVAFDEVSAMMGQLMGSRRQEIAGLLDQQTSQGLFTALKKSGIPFVFDNGQLIYAGRNQPSARFPVAWTSHGQPSVAEVTALLETLQQFAHSRNLWKRAEESGNDQLLNMEKRIGALKELMAECDIEKPCIDYEFRLWDRDPHTGMFLGNYATNCVASDDCNNAEILTYMTNHSFSMVELRDKAVKEPVGLAFVYWVTNAQGNLCMVVDSMDVSKKYLNQTDQKLIREKLAAYMQQYAAAVTGKEGTPILLGPHYNDIPYKDLPKIPGRYKFVGAARTGKAYVELLGGHQSVEAAHDVDAYVLAN